MRESDTVPPQYLDQIKHKLTAASQTMAHGQDLHALFRSIDRDRSGLLSVEELGRGIARLLSGVLDDAEIGSLLAEIDTDCSGGVTCDEFVCFCTSRTAAGSRNRCLTTAGGGSSSKYEGEAYIHNLSGTMHIAAEALKRIKSKVGHELALCLLARPPSLRC